MTKVKCPNCGTEKTIKGTEERVRCANNESCGCRFYVKNYIVPEKGTDRDLNGTKNTMQEIALKRINIMNTPGRSTLFETFREANPDPIVILFNNLDKSITSMWGVQKNGKVKWDAKYNMWLAFKKWFEDN